MISKNRQIGVWLTWLIVWPATLIYMYNTMNPSFNGRGFDLFSFAVLTCIVAFFPIIVNGTPIFFIQGLSFAVFLYFGLFYELVLTQFGVAFLMAKLRPPRTESYRIPLNLLMFLLVSVISAGVYNLLGGEHGAMILKHLSQSVPALVYAIMIFTSNQIILHYSKYLLSGQKEKFFNMGLLWEFLTTLIVIPVGFILYLLYSQIGPIAIYYIGIPFVGISVILMLYHSSRKINYYLQKTADIGHELTGQLDVKEVLDVFISRMSSMLELDYAYIYDAVNQRYLNLIRFQDNENKMGFPNIQLQKFEGISGKVFGNGKGVIFPSKKHWQDKNDPTLPSSVESVLSIPISRDNKIVGVITIASKRKRSYEKFHYMILEILTNYLAVAIQNARHYQQTKNKSERCPLTKLYNYRYFENHLQTYFDDMKAKGSYEDISLILLDLDYFKEVNDTYGHESGNEVLCELADRLENTIGEQGIVARYGGEEFVILLPGIDEDHALYLAENLRKNIANEAFIVQNHILSNKKFVEIYVTASIGVASYPQDCEDPMELIRHADRAMYMGAKRKGRNKVATYEKATEKAE